MNKKLQSLINEVGKNNAPGREKKVIDLIVSMVTNWKH